MAKSKAHAVGVIGVELPECPVCLETMSAPIFQCQSGHSLCNMCTKNLCPPICPICRQQMTQMRNWQLEEMIAKATVPCPNKSSGCVYTMISVEVDDHVKECIFREMKCPLGLVFGKCFWAGKLNGIMDHFKECHPENCNIHLDKETDLDKISITNDDRFMYLTSFGKFLFILNIKIDTSEKMAYWVIQHIGGKKFAKQYQYEIKIISKQDKRRTVNFSDHCYNDAYDVNEIFREMKCGVMPLNMLNNFIKDRKISVAVSVKNTQQTFRNKNNAGTGNQVHNRPNDRNQSRGVSPGPNSKPNYSNKQPKNPRHRPNSQNQARGVSPEPNKPKYTGQKYKNNN